VTHCTFGRPAVHGKRIKCLYVYAANKTGDHAAAIRIFEDCIQRWNDVFSMIGLAQKCETRTEDMAPQGGRGRRERSGRLPGSPRSPGSRSPMSAA
jgi:hypothetical protein